MCQIKSGIVLKDRVFMPLDYDSHEEMVEELKLNDSTKEPQFVRVEVTPKDGDIFNHNLKNWELQIDQDLIPKWFNKNQSEKEAKEKLKEWFETRFAIGKVDRINKGRWFIGKNAQVKYIHGSAQVEYIRDSAQVEYICGSAQVKYIHGSAQVKYIHGSAQVEYIRDSAQVEYICGSAQVKYIHGSAQVKYISGSAQVGSIRDSAQVEYIYGSAQVENIKDRAVCCFTADTAKFKTIKDNGMAILYYKDNPEIVVANKKIKLIKIK